ncbi:MAG: ankyrin repeat domain-containing protein [Pseudomonadota bacterium]
MIPTAAYRLIAAAFDSQDELLALLAAEPHLMHERTGLGETPLHYLAVENQLAAVKLLVEHGALVDTVNECGGTPLSESASLGYCELVAYLLSRDAKLHIAGQDEPTLHQAVRGGSAAIVVQLLSAGAAVNEQNDLRETALHLAAESDDRIEVLEVLLNAGANTALCRIFDATALDVALESGSQRCAAALAARVAPRGDESAA